MIPDSFYYILISIMIASILLAWLKSSTVFNPVSFFILWWGSFIFISSINFVGIRTPRIDTFWILLTALALYSIGSVTFLKNSSSCHRINSVLLTAQVTGEKSVFLKVFLYAQIVTTFILLVFLRKSIGMLSSLDAGTYRFLVYSDIGVFEGHKLLLNYYIRPSVFTAMFVTMAGVYLGSIKKKYFILAVINIFIYSAVILGRSSVILLIMCSVIGVVYIYDRGLIRIKKRYAALVLIPFIFIISMSVFRRSQYLANKSGMEIVARYFIWYLTAPFTAFDYFLNTYREGADYNFTYIRSVLGGIEEFFDPLIKKFYPDFSQVNNSSYSIIAEFRDFGGPATHHNSHYTMLFTFYKDAGIIGIALFSYFFGAFTSSIYNSFRENPKLFNFIILILLTYLGIMGTTRWELMFAWPWTIIILSFFVTKKFIFEKKPKI